MTGTPPPSIVAILLAAGLSRRMAGENKLLHLYAGQPLILHMTQQILASHIEQLIIVTGPADEAVPAALRPLNSTRLQIVPAPGHERGLAHSLAAGIRALPSSAKAAMICLADMPLLTAKHYDQLIAAFDLNDAAAIYVPVFKEWRGNPILWPKHYFHRLAHLQGDQGGRILLEASAAAIREIEMADEAVLRDFDTPEEWALLDTHKILPLS